jgi:hypothetical protein
MAGGGALGRTGVSGGRGRLRRGRLERHLGLLGLLGLVALAAAGDPLLELAHPIAESPTHLGQLLGAHDQQEDDDDYERVCQWTTKHLLQASLSGLPSVGGLNVQMDRQASQGGIWVRRYPRRTVMSHQPDPHIRREADDLDRAAARQDDPQADGLHVCPECASHLVQPIEWREAPEGFWELILHCPNCDWLDGGVFDQGQVDALEERLDEGLTEILTDLRRLTQSNMAEEIERFTAALQGDLVLPEDF